MAACFTSAVSAGRVLGERLLDEAPRTAMAVGIEDVAADAVRPRVTREGIKAVHAAEPFLPAGGIDAIALAHPMDVVIRGCRLSLVIRWGGDPQWLFTAVPAGRARRGAKDTERHTDTSGPFPHARP